MTHAGSWIVRGAGAIVAGTFMLLMSGCGSAGRATNAPYPPESLSEPVTAKPAEPKTDTKTTDEFGFLKDGQAAPSAPLPAVSVPTNAGTAAASPKVAAPGTKPEYYVMQKGDTLYGIARKFNIPPKELIVANNFTNPNVLPVGTKVRLP